MQTWEFEWAIKLIVDSNGYWDEPTAVALAKTHDTTVQNVAENTVFWLMANT